MARTVGSILAFNRGLISRIGLARIDLKRTALSAEIMNNWMPRVLGSMMLRPGLQYIGSTLSNNPTRMIPFVFSTTDTALLELTSGFLRVWIDDALVTRNNVNTTITNGSFTTNLAGWTDNDVGGAVSSWVAPGYMQLVGDGTNAAIRDQEVTVAGFGIGLEHGIHISVARGPVVLRIGSSLGDDGYVNETTLNTGEHSLAITPSGNFWIRFKSSAIRKVWVNSCVIEAAGVMSVATPWMTMNLSAVVYAQSADVIFVACSGLQQYRIERRSTRSWSVAVYLAPDGPLQVQNVSTTTLTGSSISSGNITLTASNPVFYVTHIGVLVALTSTGQSVSLAIAAQNTFSTPILVDLVGTSRSFLIQITGTFVATVVLQRSVGSIAGPWTDVVGKSWTAPTAENYADGLDNQIIYYRLGIETGSYTSGTATVLLSIGYGSITGIVRVTDFSSPTSVGAEVLVSLGSTSATEDWALGEWSDFRGWPSAVALDQGRLWWAGKSRIWGSVSDQFDSFDANVVGDSGPLARSIGSGPVDHINWILPLQRLVLGTPGSEISVRSSALDEALTPTNFNLRAGSNQGSASVQAIKVDQRGIFVNRTGAKVFELVIGTTYPAYEYGANDLTAIVPELGMAGIVRMDSQRQPDTRIHCVRADGVVMILVSDPIEDVRAWVTLDTQGLIEDVAVLPAITGNMDDRVYYVVKRTINGATVRSLEKMAQEADCHGDQPLCNLADSFVTYSASTIKTVSGLSNLEGESVVVWADGSDVGTNAAGDQIYTVSGGQITLADPASNIVIGLPYTAQFKSSKLGQAVQGIESPLNMQKKMNHVGLILADVHPQGLKYGPEFSYMDNMPLIEQGYLVGDGVRADYDENTIEFPGIWNTDMRLCLQASAPRPVTVLAVTIESEMHK